MYETFSKTRKKIIILDEFVKMRWNNRNKEQYVDKGYVYTKQHDEFMIRPKDLSHGSKALVMAMCPICSDTRKLTYKSIRRAGHTLCNGCSQIIDLSGMVFGRWHVIEFLYCENESAHWKCLCTCGTERDVASGGLISGASRSCGCYKDELSRERVGEKNHNWNSEKTEEERFVGRGYRGYSYYIKDVMRRDDYQCQACGAVDTEKEVHHLYSYSYYPEYATNPEFGITICKKEHMDFHMWMGGHRVPCTPSDFDRWLYTIS